MERVVDFTEDKLDYLAAIIGTRTNVSSHKTQTNGFHADINLNTTMKRIAQNSSGIITATYTKPLLSRLIHCSPLLL